MKLHQITNGDWIDLSIVTSISAAAPHPEMLISKEAGLTIEPISARVIIRTTESTHMYVLEFNDFNEACKARDELARLVNGVSPSAQQEPAGRAKDVLTATS